MRLYHRVAPLGVYYDLAISPLYVEVHSRYLGEDVLKHIEVHTLVCLDVLYLALKGLSAERLAVKPHVVQVCSTVIDYLKAVSRCLVASEAHSQSVAEIDEIPAARHCDKPPSSELQEYRLCYLIFHSRGF